MFGFGRKELNSLVEMFYSVLPTKPRDLKGLFYGVWDKHTHEKKKGREGKEKRKEKREKEKRKGKEGKEKGLGMGGEEGRGGSHPMPVSQAEFGSAETRAARSRMPVVLADRWRE